jgi:3-oxoacyl-[acyl-carrier protein] reductase
MRLQGRTAIVTGGSRGIGAAIARRLARDGARVAVNYSRSPERAEQVVADIRAAGGEAVAIQADLADPSAPAMLFQQAAAALGAPGILVNNAAIFEGGGLSDLDLGPLERQFAVNVYAPILCAREAARVMESGGRIIHISSGLGTAPAPNASVYGATKAALDSFARSHAVELGPRGITVNCVAPGTTDTEMLRGGVPEDALAALVAATPLGRLGRPEDIADVVAFLASDDARWVTGQVIGVSGGLR